MKKPSGRDIWLARNQPYGYWRVGNPIVKLSIIFMLLYGLLQRDTGFIVQNIVLIFIILYLPYSTKSRFSIIFMNFGVGSIIVAFVYPKVLNYQDIHLELEMKNIATVDITTVILVAILAIIFFLISRAFTSRDYAWLFDFPQKVLRISLAGYIHSYAYTLLRGYDIIRRLDISIRSRGIPRPYKIIKLQLERRLELFGVWLRNLDQECTNLEKVIKFVIISRYKEFKRKTPIWRSWSETDISITGVIMLTIILPRLLSI